MWHVLQKCYTHTHTHTYVYILSAHYRMSYVFFYTLKRLKMGTCACFAEIYGLLFLLICPDICFGMYLLKKKKKCIAIHLLSSHANSLFSGAKSNVIRTCSLQFKWGRYCDMPTRWSQRRVLMICTIWWPYEVFSSFTNSICRE